jgi:hypothetical protein
MLDANIGSRTVDSVSVDRLDRLGIALLGGAWLFGFHRSLRKRTIDWC